ncbi:MAG: SDR family NAD(P)-dependent oxidoreductase, partial [Acidobacteriota bacterium]|nr:SDR family NAD(P)-dependent oxidoreductase [Acidobacteriota bacterium]
MRFSDRTVLITGGGRGIGRSIALRFAEEGARVAVVARTDAELEETTRQVEAAGARCLSIAADIRERGSAESSVSRAESELGPVDVLVNNAGVYLWKPFLTMTG